MMDTINRVAPVVEPRAIKFGARKKTCTMARISGTEWQQSDHRRVFKSCGRNLEGRKSPLFLPRFGKRAGAF